MERYAEELLGRYRSSGVVVDTNLLLLYFIGEYEQELIERWSRTADMFVSEDLETLLLLLDRFQRIVVTPHILTEVSNMLNQLSEPARSDCLRLLSNTVQTKLTEKRQHGSILSRDAQFHIYGISDISILDAAANSYLVLTEDLPLSDYLGRRGVDVLNFNQIRWLAY